MRRWMAAVAGALVLAGGLPAKAAPVRCAGKVATVVGGRSGEEMKGTRGDDVIHGMGGTDTIVALGGDDLICTGAGGAAVAAGPGHDRVLGSASSDAVDGGPGADVLDGDEGEDALAGGPGDDVLRGDGGGDVLGGGPGDDSVYGGDAADVIAAGAGSDVIDGGGHEDVVSFVKSKQRVTLDLGAGAATGGGTNVLRRIEHATGSRFGDRLVGDARSNTLLGLDGPDRIGGLGGGDTVIGGEGNDGLSGGSGKDVVSFVTGRAVTVDLAAGRATGQGRDALDGFEAVEGSSRGDDLFGSARDETFMPVGRGNSVDGRGGRDLVSYRGLDTPVKVDLTAGEADAGSGGTALLDNVEGAIGGSFVNEFRGNAGPDLFIGGPGTDVFEDSPGNDVFHGRKGRDSVDLSRSPVPGTVDLGSGVVEGLGRHRVTSTEGAVGSDFADTLRGSPRDDRLRGGPGHDLVAGEAGFDELYGDEGDDTLVGAGGDDLLDGGPDDDRLDAGDGFDVTLDGNGTDEVMAGPGTDVIELGDGPDSIDGGPGVDVIQAKMRDLVVDLAQGSAGGSGIDTLENVEGAAGTTLRDELTGDDSDNLLFGGLGGGDVISGAGGDDLLEVTGWPNDADDVSGGDGDDYLFTAAGPDRADGGPGTDSCWEAEQTVSCESGERVAPFAFLAPRAVSAYVSREGRVHGSVADLFGLDCGQETVAYLERREKGGWDKVQRLGQSLDVGGTVIRFGWSEPLAEPGTYRILLPALRHGNGESELAYTCAEAVSDTFTHR